MKLKNLLFLTIFLTFFAIPSLAFASEGKTELSSTTDEPYRCVTYSHLGQDRKYKVLVTCRDLIYPSTAEVFAYVMWGNPTDAGKIIKMGQLEYGKKLFTVGRSFTSIFVTKEPNPKVETPQGPVVMQGAVLADPFLDDPSSITPTPELVEVIEEATPTPTEAEEEPSTKNAVSTGLKRASIILFIFLIIGSGAALVIILRSKKR